MENIYILDWDLSHVGDAEYDAFLVPYVGSNELITDIIDDFEFDHPDIILFRGYMDILPEIDFIVTDSNAPILSKKLISIIESLGSFPHRTIPCGVVDYTLSTNKTFENFDNSILKPETKINKDFEMLHLLEILDVLDYEKSEFIMSKRKPDRISLIKKFVFKEPKRGFPPIFKIEEKLSNLFITESVKNELDAAGIKGVTYKLV